MPPAFCGTSRVEDVGLRVHFAQSARARDGGLARALNYAPERCAQGALCREKDRERASARVRALVCFGRRAHAPERRGQSVLCREKDRER